MGKYLKCLFFIYSLGLSQPSNEHRTFTKESEEHSTSEQVREQQDMETALTGFLTLPSEPCEYAPSCRLAKALAEPYGQRGAAAPLGMYLQHRIRSPAPLCWWAPRPAGAGWPPPWSHPLSRCRWWKGLCLLLAAVHTCSSQWEKGEREQGDKEKEERRKKTTPQPAMSYFCKANLVQDTQSTDIFCRSGPKEKITHLAVLAPVSLEGHKEANLCGFLKFKHTLLLNNHFWSHFLQQARRRKSNPHLSKNQHDAWEMRTINTRECDFLPSLTTNSSSHALPSSGTQTNGIENCIDSSA